jgi:hypothetical protein
MPQLTTRHERGAQTRFDRTRQTVIYVIGGLLALILVLLLAFLILISASPRAALIIQSAAGGRTFDVPRRNIDVWAVYPDDSVRFATLFYPDVGGAVPEQVDVAGPLVYQPDDILDSEVLGGELLDTVFLPGPGDDSIYVYQKLDLARDGGEKPYGAVVKVKNPPYLSVEEDSQAIALGTTPQDYYQQVIVAVAFPKGTTVVEFPDMQPYRRKVIDGWVVFYFDTTAPEPGDAITVSYRFGASAKAPPDLDPYWVDAMR